MPNATTNAILDNARAALPGVADDVINQALFNVCDDLAREALGVAAPVNVDGDPSEWLPQAYYVPNFQALLAGTLAALYGQFGKPYFSAELAKYNLEKYGAYRVLSRVSEAGAETHVDLPHERLISSIRAQIPSCRDETIELEMFAAINEIRGDAFMLPALISGTAMEGWLTADQYEKAFNAILTGTLYRLHGQANMPWFSDPAYQTNLTRYREELHRLRSAAAGAQPATDTIPERIVSTIRAQIQLVRSEAIQLAMFNVANKLRVEVYSLPPLTGAQTDYTAWLSVSQYEQSYLAMLYGTLAQLYSQSDMPWFNLDLFKAQNTLFLQELDLARSENIEAEGPSGSVIEDILEEARTYLPGARDEVLEFELRRALDEFLKFTQVWQEDIRFAARPNRRIYELYPAAKAEIVRVIAVVDAATRIGVTRFGMQNIPTLKLEFEPSAPGSWIATCALSILTGKRAAGDNCGCGANWGMPAWIIERWDEVLLNGLLWRMMMQQGKSYTNTELGVFHGQRWRAGLTDARGATRQQNVYDGQTWRYPAYA